MPDTTSQQKSNPAPSDKDKWVQKMLKTAKVHHKLCPYFDKRTKQCFITLGGSCDRDGKYDTCPVFINFLSKKYDEYVSKKKPLPLDFLDITI